MDKALHYIEGRAVSGKMYETRNRLVINESLVPSLLQKGRAKQS